MSDPELPPAGRLANDDPILTISVVILGLSAGNLLLLLVPGTLAVIRWTAVQVEVGIPLRVEPLDVILIAGLLVMQMTLGFFYHYVLPHAGETLLAQVISLLLAITLFISNYLMMDAGLFPYRLFLIAIPLMLVLQKDWVMLRRFRHTDYGKTVLTWFENVRWSLAADLFAAILFMAMFHRELSPRFLAWFFIPPVKTTAAYQTWLPAVFYSLFLFSSLRSLVRNYEYFINFGQRDSALLKEVLQLERPALPGVPQILWSVLRITRVYTMVVAGVLTAKLGILLGAASGDAALAAGALALVLGGSFALNDVADRKIDAVNVPTRPIPSGVLGTHSAVLIGGCCLFAAVILAYATKNGRVIAAILGLTALLLLYSWWLKPVPIIKNLTMAAVGISIPVVGALVARNTADSRTWWLGALIGLFTLQKEIAADVYDLNGDLEAKLRTLPILLGVSHAMWIVCGTNLALALTAVAWIVFDRASIPLLTTVAVLAIGNALGSWLVSRKKSGERLFVYAQKALQLGGIAVACAL